MWQEVFLRKSVTLPRTLPQKRHPQLYLRAGCGAQCEACLAPWLDMMDLATAPRGPRVRPSAEPSGQEIYQRFRSFLDGGPRIVIPDDEPSHVQDAGTVGGKAASDKALGKVHGIVFERAD
eukprot:s4523_g3.t1